MVHFLLQPNSEMCMCGFRWRKTVLFFLSLWEMNLFSVTPDIWPPTDHEDTVVNCIAQLEIISSVLVPVFLMASALMSSFAQLASLGVPFSLYPSTQSEWSYSKIFQLGLSSQNKLKTKMTPAFPQSPKSGRFIHSVLLKRAGCSFLKA